MFIILLKIDLKLLDEAFFL